MYELFSQQLKLLFGRSSALHVQPACRPYLLALLIHQASWTTLRHCVQQLLDLDLDRDLLDDQRQRQPDSGSPADGYEPAVVLDFLSASIQVPKLWQGRDKHVPKHQQAEDLLCLNGKQVDGCCRWTTYFFFIRSRIC